MVVLFVLAASTSNSQETTSARQVRLTITITDKSGRYVGTLGKDQVSAKMTLRLRTQPNKYLEHLRVSDYEKSTRLDTGGSLTGAA